MEDHRVDLVCPKRHGQGSAPQDQSDWDCRPWVEPNLAVLKCTAQLLVCLLSLADLQRLGLRLTDCALKCP